jgi:hypothetical protein
MGFVNRRLSIGAGAIVVALAAGTSGFASPALAVPSAASAGGVSATPASGTPALAMTKTQQKIRQVVKCGSMIYAVGHIWAITQNGTKYRRPGLFSFSATAPYKLSALNADVNGEVDSIAFTRHRGCADAYIGGSFTSVNGKSVTNIAEISTSTGQVVSTFGHNANGTVETLAGYKGHLLTGGKFKRTNGFSRYFFESLNPFSGKVDDFVNLHLRGQVSGNARQVYNQQISHGGTLDLVEGNFTSVAGQPRQQIFMLNLAGSTAKVTGWTSPEFSQHCISREAFYVRSAGWSPDDSTVYTATTGFHALNRTSGSFPLTGLCDTVAAFPAAQRSVNHKWIEYSGCDSYYSVAADSSNVYAAGHPRWTHNRYGCNHEGPGAVPDKGLQGFNAANGQVRLNSSGSARYSMSRANADSMIFTSAGLWIGSSNRFGSDTCGKVSGHSGICLLPRT